MADVKKVSFQNSVSWAGSNFSYVPGDVLSLEEEIAKARQDAGLGKIIKDK